MAAGRPCGLGLLGVLVPAFLINAVRDTEAQNAAFTGIGKSLFTTWAVPFRDCLAGIAGSPHRGHNHRPLRARRELDCG